MVRYSRALAGALVIPFLALAADASAQRAVVVVRHAERADDSKDSPLSAAGATRAAALDALLRDAAVTHVITSEYVRTRDTAGPLMARLKLRPEVVPAKDTEGLVARLTQLPADAVALVVGHSDTVPAILTALGWKGTVTIAHTQFDDAFLVVPRAGGEPAVLRLKYGQATP